MAFVLDPAASVRREVRRVAHERLRSAITSLESLAGPGDEIDADTIEDAVHDARKRCKEVRALGRLVRSSLGSTYEPVERRIRDAAAELAPIRDAHAVLATFDDLRAAAPPTDGDDLDGVRRAQQESADEASRQLRRADPRVERSLVLLREADERVDRWKVPNRFAPIRHGLVRTYRQGRKRLVRARREPTDEHLHEWRKSVKHLWYQARLLEAAAPSVIGPLVARLDALSEALGDDHDLAVMIEHFDADPDRFGPALDDARRLARRQQEELRRRAFRLGRTIFAETPDAFVDRLETYWDLTIAAGPELPTGGIAELASEEAAHRRSDDDLVGTGIERERKYLVAEMPDLADDGVELRQGYLAVDGSSSVRVRDAGDAGCTLTVKAGRGAVRTELEWRLAREAFDAAWEQTQGRRLRKTRHRVPLGPGGPVAELDVFHDDLDGFLLVEVEFESDEALAAFEPPAWFGREVTDDPRYTNAALSLHALHGPPPAA